MNILLQTGDQRSDVGDANSDSRCVLEGLGFNLCVAPFLNVCVPNFELEEWKSEVAGGSWSLVRGEAQRAD